MLQGAKLCKSHTYNMLLQEAASYKKEARRRAHPNVVGIAELKDKGEYLSAEGMKALYEAALRCA